MKPDARTVHATVTELPADLRQLVEQMLREGATFEDVVDAVAERGGDGISQSAVENYFRGNLTLQQERARRQVATAQALKKALGGSNSGQARLAEAALLTGLLRLNRKGSELNLKDTMRERIERENLSLKRRLLRLRVRKAVQDQEIARVHIRGELAKWRLTRARIVELQRTLKAGGKQANLGPETMQKIQEIYGLVISPSASPDGQNPTE
jgi:hypothetical protein